MLDTPSVIIDVEKMKRNIERMSEITKGAGVKLRPHSKTHKSPIIAKHQINAGAVGICTAKVSEAEVMAKHGVDDIFIAYPIVTEAKIARVAELSKHINLVVGVDSLEGATRIAQIANRHHTKIQVRLEVDIGFKRTGIPYEKALKLAYQIYNMEYLELTGIYTYRGAFMDGKPTLDIEQAGLEEGMYMVNLASRMRREGIPIKDISVGSTPTAPFAAKVKGITEVRPGTYVFNDRMQAKLKATSIQECAAMVRVTVVSRHSKDLMVIDGGSKTFATDVGPNTEPLNLAGFGYIIEAPHAVIERLSEEHGMVNIKSTDSFNVGDVLHVIPNHICSTVNLHNNFYFKQNGKFEEHTVYARGMLF